MPSAGLRRKCEREFYEVTIAVILLDFTISALGSDDTCRDRWIVHSPGWLRASPLLPRNNGGGIKAIRQRYR